jgi:hypothetical protein
MCSCVATAQWMGCRNVQVSYTQTLQVSKVTTKWSECMNCLSHFLGCHFIVTVAMGWDWVCVELRPLTGPLFSLQMITWVNKEQRWDDTDRGSRRNRRKTRSPKMPCPGRKPGPPSAARTRRLTTWAMAHPDCHVRYKKLHLKRLSNAMSKCHR